MNTLDEASDVFRFDIRWGTEASFMLKQDEHYPIFIAVSKFIIIITSLNKYAFLRNDHALQDRRVTCYGHTCQECVKQNPLRGR